MKSCRPKNNRLIYCHSLRPIKAYTPNQFFTDIETGIWPELKTGKPISIYRRNLQRVYVAKMLSLENSAAGPIATMYTSDLSLIDLLPVLKAHKLQLLKNVTAALLICKDEETKWHLADLIDRLKDGSETGLPEARKRAGASPAIGQGSDDGLLVKVMPFEEMMQAPQLDCWGAMLSN